MLKHTSITAILLVGIGIVSMLIPSVIASTEETIFITNTAGGEAKIMELKAERQNGDVELVSEFEITIANILSITQHDKVRVFSTEKVDFTKAIIADSNNVEKEIQIASNGIIDFSGYKRGVYVLDVLIDNDRAYEAIIVIGQQTEQNVSKEIKEINNKQITEVDIEIIFDVNCGEGFVLEDEGFCIPREDPEPPEDCDGLYIVDTGECKPFPYPDVCEPNQDLDECQDYDECIVDPVRCGLPPEEEEETETEEEEPTCETDPSLPECESAIVEETEEEIPEEEEEVEEEEEIEIEGGTVNEPESTEEEAETEE